MAPEGRTAYYYPVFYGLYLFLAIVPGSDKKSALDQPNESRVSKH
jgi:hypothetical protein